MDGEWVAGFKTPVEDRRLEDYVPGSVHEFGMISMTAEEIVAFGEKFDPQLFHTDPEGARSTIYGGLIASGWHTASLMMREVVRYYLPRAASLGSPGVDELRWLLPVRPGDRLSVRMTVLEANRSRSKPDRGIVVSLFEVLNQDRKVVMSAKGVNFILCRTSQAIEPVL
ncbi:MAG: MaoC family dehydratase [Desulfobacterales bacterium]|jgi:acyl dehydratase|nr:MaoC family dehydratase [Desulfobacterales bacterium]